QAAARALVRANLTPQQIERIFAAYPIGERYRELLANEGEERASDYLARTIAKAEAWTHPDHHRVTVEVTGAWVDRLPEREGKPKAWRAHLELKVLDPQWEGPRVLDDRF